MKQLEQMGGEVIRFESVLGYHSEIPGYSKYEPTQESLRALKTTIGMHVYSSLPGAKRLHCPDRDLGSSVRVDIRFSVGNIIVSAPVDASTVFVMDDTLYQTGDVNIITIDQMNSFLGTKLIFDAHTETFLKSMRELTFSILNDPAYQDTLIKENVAFAFPRRHDFLRYLQGDEFREQLQYRCDFKQRFVDCLDQNVDALLNHYQSHPFFSSPEFRQYSSINTSLRDAPHVMRLLLERIRFDNPEFSIFRDSAQDRLTPAEVHNFIERCI